MMLVCERRLHWIRMPSRQLKRRLLMKTFPWGKLFQSWFFWASDTVQPSAKRRFFARAAGFTRRPRSKLRWMMNKFLLDANTLIAAFDESHADHRRAHRFVKDLSRFRTSPQSQGAFLRFFTRPWTDAAGGRQLPRMSIGEAMGCLKAILGLPQHEFLADDLSFDN